MNEPMHEHGEDVQSLISGYLDGELSPDDRAKVEQRVKEDEAFRQEFERMKTLVSAASSFRVEIPPEEVWDTFLDGVYNRLERRTGWLLLIAGSTILTLYAIYSFVTQPWGPALLKVACAVPVVGAVLLFISVLRQRLAVARTDRYSREVKR
jgi:anti-sigma factor RsiW